MADPLPPAAPGSVGPAPVSVPDPKNDPQSATSAAGSTAQKIAPQFGGLRAGRKRADGLIPGSQEAIDADRKKDRERKARARLVAQPPPLPAATNGRPLPTVAPAPGPIVVPVAAGPAVVDFIPWRPDQLAPVFAQLIPAAEGISVKQIVDKARKAQLPPPVVAKLEIDAAWNPLAKKGLETAGPEVAAKWLNYFGISSENAQELVLVSALLTIAAGHVLILKRLDNLAKSHAEILAERERQKQAAAAAAATQAAT